MSGANDQKWAPTTTTTTTTTSTSTTLASEKTEDKTNNNLGHAGLSPLLISAAPSSPLPSSPPSSSSSLPSSSSSLPSSLHEDGDTAAGPEADELAEYWALKSRLNVVYDALFPSLRVTTASPRHVGGASPQNANHVHQWAEYQALRSRCLEAAAKVSKPPPAARLVPPSPAPAAPSTAPAAPSPAPAAPWSSRWALQRPARDAEAEYAADFPPFRVAPSGPPSQSLSRPGPSKSRQNNGGGGGGGGGASWRTTGKWNACPELTRFRYDGPETTAADYTETPIPSLQYIADEIFTCPYHTCTPNCTGIKACRSLGFVHLKKFHPICSRRDIAFGREKPKPWCHREEAKQIRFHETFKPSKKN